MGKFVKTTFVSVNIISAIIVIALASYTVFYYIRLKDVTDLRNQQRTQLDLNVRFPQLLPHIFVPLAIIALLIISCGLCGIRNKGALIVYNIFTLLLILAVAGTAVTIVLVGMTSTESFLRETLVDAFSEARTDPYMLNRFKDFEVGLNCCGANSARDHGTMIPVHCCWKGVSCSNSLLNQKKGCYEIAKVYTEWSFYGMCAACCAIGFLGVISIVLSCFIITKMKGKSEEY